MSEERIVVDVDSLTWGEFEEIEKMCGGEAAQALLRGQVYPSAMVALVFIAKRRDNPKLLIEEIRRLPISTDIDVRTGREEVDPETGKELDPTSAPSDNGDSSTTPSSVSSTGSALPSYDG